MNKAEFGLIGLAVMGQNLSRNIARNKVRTIVYNRTGETTKTFIKEHGSNYLRGEIDLKVFIGSLLKPRRIMLMIKAGDAVDAVIKQLTPLLDKGDVIIDGGNSHFHDTIRRESELKKKGIHFIGCGVSGGEEGALNGPSLMPGGSKEAWKLVRPVFEKIAAKDFTKKPCVTHVGENGAGHYVKMVHNGIEYGVMQLISEGYHMLKSLYNLKSPEVAEIFTHYNKGRLKSFLFEIAVPVLTKKDDIGKKGYLIDKILDKAGQKGTGKWTSVDALDRGVTLSTLTEAVFARTVSSQKELRVKLSKLYKKSTQKNALTLEQFAVILEDALYAGMLTCYAQGYDLIQTAGKEQHWKIDLAEVSRIWEGGCIIRSVILNFLHNAYQKAGKDRHLFEIPAVSKDLKDSINNLRNVTALSCLHNVPAPALASSLAYFDAITSAQTSANLIQGLRDYFGAHMYERMDKKGVFHTEW
jgi:6-phosphogluconate dehydrogenase